MRDLLLLALVASSLAWRPTSWRGSNEGWRLMLLQSLVTGIGYAFFFRLQQVGGPVYLSQISYVNTGVGVAFAVLAFRESAADLDLACGCARLRRRRARHADAPARRTEASPSAAP